MKLYLSRKTLRLPETIKFLLSMMKNAFLSHYPDLLRDPAFQGNMIEEDVERKDEWEYGESSCEDERVSDEEKKESPETDEDEEVEKSEEREDEGENNEEGEEVESNEEEEVERESSEEEDVEVESSNEGEEEVESSEEEEVESSEGKEQEMESSEEENNGKEDKEVRGSVNSKKRKREMEGELLQRRKVGVMEILSSPKKRRSLNSEIKAITSSARANPSVNRKAREGRGLNLWREKT